LEWDEQLFELGQVPNRFWYCPDQLILVQLPVRQGKQFDQMWAAGTTTKKKKKNGKKNQRTSPSAMLNFQ
jgi:hypothetical protein